MNQPTPDRLAEIEARLKAATRGPWKLMDTGFEIEPQIWIQFIDPEGGDCSIASVRRGCDEAGPHSQNLPDAAFIANAPSDIALLLEVVKLQREWLAKYGIYVGKVDALLSGSGG